MKRKGKRRPFIQVRVQVNTQGFAAEVGKQTAFSAVRWAAPRVAGLLILRGF